MLKAFSDIGIKVGINWYLTENDGSNDGKFIQYLNKNDLRWYNPDVFDLLKKIAYKKNKNVQDIQKSRLLKGAVYYDELLYSKGTTVERAGRRSGWFDKSVDILKETELIFMDPDNGLMEKNDPSALKSLKYVMPDEVERYFTEGHNVVYYCQKGRRSLNEWMNYITLMFDRIPSAKPAVLSFHKGTYRAYVFLIHEESYVKYRKIINGFLGKWRPVFNEDFTNKGNIAGASAGEKVTIERSDGSIETVFRRNDGSYEFRNSKTPNTGHVFTVEQILRHLGV